MILFSEDFSVLLYPSSEQPHNIINYSVDSPRHRSVENNRPCNCEDFCSNPHNVPLAFVINGAGCHRIGKACNGYEGACPCHLCHLIKNAKACQCNGYKNKSYAGKGDYADLEIIDELSSDVEYYAIGFKKGSDLTAKVNDAIKQLEENGKLMELAEKYGFENVLKVIENID